MAELRAKEQSSAPVQTWAWPAGDQLREEGPVSAGGWQVNHEPAVCPGCQAGQRYAGVH